MREHNANVGSVVFESGHDGVREREAAGCTQDSRRLQRADDVPGRRPRLHHGALGERLTIITAGNSDLPPRAYASAEGTVHRYVDLARWRCARHPWPAASTHEATPTIRPNSNQGLLDNRNILTCQLFPYTCTPASLVPSPLAAPSSARRTARSPGTAAGCVQTFGAEGNQGSTRARARDCCSAAEAATRTPSSGCWCRTGAGRGGPVDRPVAEPRSRLLEADEVARYLGMRTDWVYREVRAGRLPHIRLGRAVRFRRESIEAWLESDNKSRARRGFMTRVGVLPLHASGGSGGVGSVVTALVLAAIELSVSALSFGRANREASRVPEIGRRSSTDSPPTVSRPGNRCNPNPVFLPPAHTRILSSLGRVHPDADGDAGAKCRSPRKALVGLRRPSTGRRRAASSRAFCCGGWPGRSRSVGSVTPSTARCS